jgi:hypothetical protein
MIPSGFKCYSTKVLPDSVRWWFLSKTLELRHSVPRIMSNPFWAHQGGPGGSRVRGLQQTIPIDTVAV